MKINKVVDTKLIFPLPYKSSRWIYIWFPQLLYFEMTHKVLQKQQKRLSVEELDTVDSADEVLKIVATKYSQNLPVSLKMLTFYI
jgi:hypothetical protein